MDRGRDRHGGQDDGRIREEVEREQRHPATDRIEGSTAAGTSMTAIYASEPAGEGRERIDCAGFEELDRGLALSSDAGERIAYVPYERLIAVEPK